MTELSEHTKKRLVELAPGVLVERDVLGVIEKIQDYDSNLRVQYCERSASPADAPYQIVEICPDGFPRVVFQVWELNDLVLERLRLADTRKVDVLTQVEQTNAQKKKDQQRRYRDMMDETKVIVGDIVKSPKSTYTVKDPLTGELHKFE